MVLMQIVVYLAKPDLNLIKENANLTLIHVLRRIVLYILIGTLVVASAYVIKDLLESKSKDFKKMEFAFLL